jgi:hypothetical protein
MAITGEHERGHGPRSDGASAPILLRFGLRAPPPPRGLARPSATACCTTSRLLSGRSAFGSLRPRMLRSVVGGRQPACPGSAGPSACCSDPGALLVLALIRLEPLGEMGCWTHFTPSAPKRRHAGAGCMWLHQIHGGVCPRAQSQRSTRTAVNDRPSSRVHVPRGMLLAGQRALDGTPTDRPAFQRALRVCFLRLRCRGEVGRAKPRARVRGHRAVIASRAGAQRLCDAEGPNARIRPWCGGERLPASRILR